MALGNPQAIARDGEVSASWGIISNVLRQAPRGDPQRSNNSGSSDTLHHFGTLIQTDAKLNLGFSGGALINLRGEMVGLTVSYAAAAGYESAAGFAIPVNDAFRRAVDTLKQGRKPEFGFLGVELEPIAAELRQAGVHGALLTSVLPATPAARADLKPGDVISHINGDQVRDDDDLIRLVSSLPPETNAEFTIVRGNLQRGRTRIVRKRVLLSKKFVATHRPQFGTAEERSWRGVQVDYATAAPNFRSLAHRIDRDGCVHLSRVENDSPAWQAGLRAGMLTTHVQRRRVVTPAEFYAAVDGRDGDVRLHMITADGTTEVRTISP
jgi:S1-C subfamily serine protease